MVLHHELLRKVLLEVEKLPNDGRSYDITVDGYTDSEVCYHLLLMHEAGFIVGQNVGSQGRVAWRAKRLTYSGHEFLESIRDDGFYEKLQKMVKEKTGSITVEGLKVAAPILIQRLVGGA